MTDVDKDQLAPIAIPQHDGTIVGRLVPVASRHCEDSELVTMITSWRARDRDCFFSQFEPTTDSTARWMRSQLVSRLDRIMFLIQDNDGRTVGHCGLTDIDRAAGLAEADGVIQGERSQPRNLVFLAEKAMIAWAVGSLGVGHLRTRILRSNHLSINLFVRLGFEKAGDIRLRRNETSTGIVLEPDPEGNDASAVEMLFTATWSRAPGDE